MGLHFSLLFTHFYILDRNPSVKRLTDWTQFGKKQFTADSALKTENWELWNWEICRTASRRCPSGAFNPWAEGRDGTECDKSKGSENFPAALDTEESFSHTDGSLQRIISGWIFHMYDINWILSSAGKMELKPPTVIIIHQIISLNSEYNPIRIIKSVPLCLFRCFSVCYKD